MLKVGDIVVFKNSWDKDIYIITQKYFNNNANMWYIDLKNFEYNYEFFAFHENMVRKINNKEERKLKIQKLNEHRR